MGQPKNKIDVCLNCKERIYWRRPQYPSEVKAAVEAYESAYRDRQRAWNKENPTQPSYKFPEKREPPYVVEHSSTGWYHNTPYGDVRHCPNPVKNDRKNRYREVAIPTNYCVSSTDTGWHSEMCNRPQKFEHRGEPMCGMHYRPIREQQEREVREAEEAAIKQWARDSLKEKIARLATFGLEAEIHSTVVDWAKYKTQMTGKVTIDPDALLALLEEEEF